MIVELCPPRSSPEFYSLNHSNGTIVDICPEFVKKRFRTKEQVEHLKNLYEKMKVS